MDNTSDYGVLCSYVCEVCMPKLKKTKGVAKLKKDLWKLFSLHQKFVYSDDGLYCQCYTCDRPLEIGTTNCQGGHCLSKAAYSILYFDERAVRPQCYYCNINLGGNEYVFNEKLKEEIGEDEWQEMYDGKHEKVKRSVGWYLDKIDYYKQAIKELQQARGV